MHSQRRGHGLASPGLLLFTNMPPLLLVFPQHGVLGMSHSWRISDPQTRKRLASYAGHLTILLLRVPNVQPHARTQSGTIVNTDRPSLDEKPYKGKMVRSNDYGSIDRRELRHRPISRLPPYAVPGLTFPFALDMQLPPYCGVVLSFVGCGRVFCVAFPKRERDTQREND